MKDRLFLPWAGLAFVSSAACLLLTACSRGTAQPQPQVPSVTVAPVEQREIVEWDEFTGRTEPVESVDSPSARLWLHPGSQIPIGTVGQERRCALRD